MSRTLIIALAGILVASCSAESALREKAEEALKVELRDPESAKFSDMLVYPEHELVCGRFNARNAYGGYAGEEMFAYDNGRIFLASDSWSDFQRRHDKCLAQMNAQTEAMKARAARMREKGV